MRRLLHPGPDFAGRLLVWAGLAALLGGLWEVGQSPFYFHGYRPEAARIIVGLLRSALIDAAIAVAGYLSVWIALRDARWMRHQAHRGTALFVVACFVLAAIVEWMRVGWLELREYADVMPTVFGLGVIPLVQWFVLAPLIVLAMRKLD